jgi:hypothetical protein
MARAGGLRHSARRSKPKRTWQRLAVDLWARRWLEGDGSSALALHRDPSVAGRGEAA